MLSPLRILVAEDEDTNFLYISALLTRFNHCVFRAVNGKEAVEFVKEENNIDLVLMDIKMPILNGYDALRLIKKIRPFLPVVAQTAYALSDDEQNIRAAGFDGYLPKPIMKNQLVGIIDSIIKH
ncbi:MAG: response regulator [Bacteroidetes bacterium HGW-Bacteroidetes-10]|nr:MAG: response regulator [Bacteroidetes bacterium HGW-Bacteroidetes-10]